MFDRDDAKLVARFLIYSAIVLFAAGLLGLAVRVFMWMAFG